jgi:Bacterial Ig-like domain
MNHSSTEAAVQITPATDVAFSWSANTLAVQPTSGNLAPNTQYQVTIGPGAKTQSGQRLASPTTITFVTQPSATPAPTPTPTVRATPTPLTGEHRLAAVPSVPFYTPQWSADSATIYVVGDKGALESVTLADGTLKVLVPDGVSDPTIAPAGDRLAYVRGGKIEILTFADGTTAELTAPPQLTALGWAKDQLLLGAKDGIYTADVQGPIQVASIPPDSIGIVSISPDGAHAIYEGATQSLFVLDITTSRITQLGTVSGASFLGWSPDGLRLLYSGPDGTVVADDQGETIATLLTGEPSWSSQDEILLGNDTNLYAVRPDGFGLTKLTSGTYHLPVWAPNGTAFAFVRGGAIWTANVTPLPAEPSALAQADSVVDSFMTARLQGQANLASALLDAKGKQAYSAGGLPLLITGDATFSRYYVLTQEITGTNPDTATFVVRLVLTKDKLDVSDFEETLTLQRDNATQPFLIDQATASQPRDLGKGAEVVGVEVVAGSIKVVFDSDLVTDTVTDGVVLLDATGKRMGDASTYTNRTATITGLQLTPGAPYKLVVMTTVQDVGGRNVATEYDLNLIGPAAGANGGGSAGGNVNNPPSPDPSPIPTPSPVVTPAS